MGDKSGIQWTEATWNPVAGCAVVSPGCTNCYAMIHAHRLERMGGKAGEKYAGLTTKAKGQAVWTGKVRTVPEALDQPLRWKRPRLIFVNSMSDLFHEDVPADFIDDVFAVMAMAPQHRFQILTKRAERMREYMGYRNGPGGRVLAKVISRNSAHRGWLWPLPNVWLGVSAEDQRRWDERVEHLAATPAAIRFVSAEPLLGRIDAGNAFDAAPKGSFYKPIDWVIIGGESGPRARPMDLEWVEWMIKQCRWSNVPVFVKQLGSWAQIGAGRHYMHHRKGGDPSEWPERLRVREMPA